MNVRPLAHPTGWLPPAMSLLALALVVFHVAVHGTAREPDEGTAAHLFQILILAQLPIIALFAFRRLPQSPRQAWPVLVLQAIALAAALAPVAYFGL